MSRRLKRTNLFSKDVSSLLYAYGDVPQPLLSTTHCLDEVVAQYLVDVCTSAVNVSHNSNRNKVRLEDFKFALRKDPIKLGRAEELIATNKVITEAKKQFNETDNSSLKRFRGQNGEEEDEDDGDDDNEQDDNDVEGTVDYSTTKNSSNKKASSKKNKKNKNSSTKTGNRNKKQKSST
ncbi:similar to Saccharomyces cerevisiae YML098W TAF13 TFIID subunit (19 kDa) [Maudiozyma barnettii]|uniref:Transcription initiation factor TFIID subunit 13 n=1 Tax=Maudiozyma barnettii TaxID=61262 RepID=A0A8H2VD25_9SACH|nr:Taf13p [Kazachstania barnettii]CAB4252983.1 similar to Saccharomyces cerevisiae YML098W TAF13 TFIID subunit (19 kDa) [Kazachstania barnettii]CAD1780786.1 similar to Saccharomyces cerevisiae YML098W TAF13 TFIID subunit (19 kDa) [Kazachstania barnettii]